jgi:hypothetical protein
MKPRHNTIYTNYEIKQAITSDNDTLITMYIKGTNKYALSEMKMRGLY